MSAPWTPEQNASLLAIAPKVRTSLAEWFVIAEQFPGRSVEACRQQFYKLRLLPAGELPQRKKYSARGPRRRTCVQVAPPPQLQPQHTSAFAEHFGDPPPGRSAFDRRAPDAVMPSLRCDLPRRAPLDQTRAGLT